VELCSTRGELAAVTKPSPQNKREIHYALDCREDEVFLVQRKWGARLMAGMWELPELETSAAQGPHNKKKGEARSTANGKTARNPNGEIETASFTLRHSITVTDYTVRVWQRRIPDRASGEWIALRRLPRVAMTGLARKILRTAGLLS
jgi:adenine-specific DNA glycosylase